MPSGPATRFGRSPTWGPSTVIRPCLLPRGLKWPPAEPKLGGSHRPTSWMWNPWRPGGSSDTSTAIITPYGASTSTALPTTLPSGLRNSALAVSRSTSPGTSQLGIWAPGWGPAGASARATWAAQTSSTPPATSAKAFELVGHSARACRKPSGLTASEDLAGERHPDSTSAPHLQRERNAPDHHSEASLRRTRRGTADLRDPAGDAYRTGRGHQCS